MIIEKPFFRKKKEIPRVL